MPAPARTTLLAYLALGAAVLFFGLRWLRHDAGGATPARAGPAAAPVIERAPQARTVVHVAGAVRRPGVYSFGRGARVRDAIRRAGGAARGGDQNAINLAAKLADGQQVIVPRRAQAAAGAAGAGGGTAGGSAVGTSAGAATGSGTAAGGTTAGGATPGTAGAPISLGSATLEQLDALDGVGPVTAQKILERRAQGGLATIDDLAQVPGIGPKRLESLRRQLVP
jgi:competence protein ComEA